MPDSFEKTARLIYKHIAGELDEIEQQELEAWLAADERHRAFFARVTNKQELEKELETFTSTNKDAQLRKINRRLFPQPVRFWKYAAAAAILITLLTGVYKYFIVAPSVPLTTKTDHIPVTTRDKKPGGNITILTLSDGSSINLDSAQNGTLALQGNTKLMKWGEQLSYETAIANTAGVVLYNTISIPRGGRYQVTLADGSKVWLNALSSLRYPSSFTGSDRTVELSGEAYFEVAKNKEKPFRVKVPSSVPGNHQMEVEVLGTHFNVNAYADEPGIRTTLLEGSVKIINDNGTVLLKPGEQATALANGNIRVKNQPDMDASVSWTTGKFEFQAVPIQTVMRQVARWYNVQIVYEGEIPHLFTGVIDKSKPAVVSLKPLESYGVVHFETSGDTIIVKP